MDEAAVLAAWMFDAIPWNPWVFWPMPTMVGVGTVFLLGGWRQGAKHHWMGAPGEVAQMNLGIGSFFLIVSLVWLAVSFFVNWELEDRSDERAIRDTCFAVMDEYADRVGVAEDVGGPAALMRTFLELPEGDPGVDSARQDMAELGCEPSLLKSHLYGWEERIAEMAEEDRQRAAFAIKRGQFESLGGVDAVRESVGSLP